MKIICGLFLCLLFVGLCFGQVADSFGRINTKNSFLTHAIVFNKIDPKLTADDEERRFIEVLIKPRDFTKSKLTYLFQFISKRFPAPDTLYVNVFTDIKDIQTPAERRRGVLIGVDANGKETQIYPSVKDVPNQKDTATFIRYDGRMRFVMNYANGRSLEVETNTQQ